MVCHIHRVYIYGVYSPLRKGKELDLHANVRWITSVFCVTASRNA